MGGLGSAEQVSYFHIFGLRMHYTPPQTHSLPLEGTANLLLSSIIFWVWCKLAKVCMHFWPPRGQTLLPIYHC